MKTNKIALIIGIIIIVIVAIVGIITFSGPSKYFTVTGPVQIQSDVNGINGVSVPISQNTYQNISYVCIPYYYGTPDISREVTIAGGKNIIMLGIPNRTPGLYGTTKSGLNGMDIIATPSGNTNKTLQKIHLNIST